MPPGCTHRHHPDITLLSPWSLPAVTSASPPRHSGIPVTADDCVISLPAGDGLRAKQLAADLGYREFLVLMSSSASPLPCLPPASALCALALRQGAYTAEEASYRFAWRVCNERGMMTLRIHRMPVFSLGPSVMFLLFFFPSLCSAQAASGEVARRHVRPCAHCTCINSIRKSSGQTFQTPAFNSSLGRLCWQPGDFQGAWTCASTLSFCLLIPTALLTTSPEHVAVQLLQPSHPAFPPERSPPQRLACTCAPAGTPALQPSAALALLEGEVARAGYQKVPQQGQEEGALVGQGSRRGQFSLVVAISEVCPYQTHE